MKVGARLNSKHGEMCVCELIRKTGDNTYIIKTHEDVYGSKSRRSPFPHYVLILFKKV